MGGTSFDICMVRDGEIPTTTEAWVQDERVAIKMVDIQSGGAGGGSIAWIDQLGLLRVGPRSAGGDPGPACYRKGGPLTEEERAVMRLHPHTGAQILAPLEFFDERMLIVRPSCSWRGLSPRCLPG